MNTPVTCSPCGEPIEAEDNVRSINEGTAMAHLECIQLLWAGGIGHLEDHVLWCEQRNDPHGGRTFRQSALEVSRWLADGKPIDQRRL